jgi:DNA-binding NarL/FixJ family response regulator
VIGEAGDGPEAIRLARKLQPRVAVHRANIMETLGIHNTAGLVYAIRTGLATLP